MSVFESPPCHSARMEKDNTYQLSTTDLRDDALDDMMHRIHIQSKDPDYTEEAERDQLQQQSDSFMNAMSAPGSRRIDASPVPNVHVYSTSTPVSHQPVVAPDECNQFNLENIKPLTPPKWKDSDNILEDFKKFKRSCLCIFDGPMAHITNGKVKTNMFLIWAGPDGEDVFENLHLSSSQQYNLDAVFEAFERYCKPICNFCAARFKFRAVKQYESETINTFYHRILHLAKQCQFENSNEHLIDAIMYWCKSKKAQDK